MQWNLSLAQALRAGSSLSIAFVGAGGKTTGIFQLAKELPPPVIVTATSHLGVWQTVFADRHLIAETPDPLERLEHGVRGVVLVTGPLDGERTSPISPDVLEWLQQFCRHHTIPLLIEADGSREKPLKAWADHEPPIPDFVDSVVQVAGLNGLGKPLTEEHIHRPELFSKLSGLSMGETITTNALIDVLTHRNGGLKNIPVRARRIALLNQADTPELQSMAQEMKGRLLAAYDSVVITSLKQRTIFAVYEPVAGIILAAGGSKRFGQPKQMLAWKGEPFVRVVAKTALQAGLSPVIVVTGANADRVESAVTDLNVSIVRNQDWGQGQAASIKAGVGALDSSQTVGGAVFLLSDQPQLTSSILRALVEKHASALWPIVAPMVMDQRANPVLFDRATFPDLLTLEGDVGGRAIFHKHHVEYLPWHDDRLLLDVDTPEMYQRLISDESL